MTEEKETLVKYRIVRANQSLNEAVYLIDGFMWNLAVNRLYYSCFYAVSALLLCIDLYPKTHKGVRALYHKHFIATDKHPFEFAELYEELFDSRQEGDYKDYVTFKSEFVIPFVEKTKKFINFISDYILVQYINDK